MQTTQSPVTWCWPKRRASSYLDTARATARTRGSAPLRPGIHSRCSPGTSWVKAPEFSIGVLSLPPPQDAEEVGVDVQVRTPRGDDQRDVDHDEPGRGDVQRAR